jgi:hypothetical protein
VVVSYSLFRQQVQSSGGISRNFQSGHVTFPQQNVERLIFAEENRPRSGGAGAYSLATL